ncbi:MAG TPA: cyclophilin-like fold protein [Longimicrobium sp.]
MKIRIWIESEPRTATLEDHEAARELAAMLPLSLTLEDYAGEEKIAVLPRRLPAGGAPPTGTAGTAGEIAYFPPWGNLAVFYLDFRYSHGLVRLGRLDAGWEALGRADTVNVTIELIEEERES